MLNAMVCRRILTSLCAHVISRSKLGLILAFGAVCLISAPAQATSLLIDSFDDGFFAFSHDQSLGLSEQQFGSMLGGDRIVMLSTDRRKTTVSASVLEGSSLLLFDTGTGDSGNLASQGSVVLTYSGVLGLDLSSFDAFELDFPSLQGAGEVAIVLNSGGFGTDSTRVALQTGGTLLYPFAAVNNGHDFSDVDQISIHVIGLTTDFAVSLDEVRIVPEPSSVVLLSGLCLLLLRTRSGIREFRGGR
jgi:hypothetical protein